MSNNKNKQLGLALSYLTLSMICLTFAAVPIYSLFCKVTGFGGTTQQDIIYHTVKGTKSLDIKFDANVDLALPWRFISKQHKINTLVGQNNLVFYEAENLSDKDIIGTSVYNVTPNKAGKYFVKIHCFCFEEQLLKAGEKVLMPVSFFIDPEMEKDPEMDDVKVITLSYSFFKIKEIAP